MRTVAFCLASAAFAAASQAAVVVSFSPDKLPTQQGWNYQTTGLHSGLSEVLTFTPGTTVTVNTMGRGINMTSSLAGARNWLSESSFTDATYVEILLRARVLRSESQQYHYGFGVSIQGADRWMGFGLSDTHVQYPNLDTSLATFDPTHWHDYRMVGDWRSGGWELYVDGNKFSSGRLAGQVSPASVYLGDSTGTANAAVEVASFSSTIVPAPTGVAVFACVGIACLRRSRRR